ncbi:hypothetical protein C2S52_018145 [Perilla frutescens var. hirtella]|nr:hypothetical protein C2S52_018145 [Perilla frutescens var. hirtella]
MVPHISSSTSSAPLVVVAPVPAPLATVVPVSLPVMALYPMTSLSPLPIMTFAPPMMSSAPSLPTHLSMSEPVPAPIRLHTPRAPVPPPASISPPVMKPTPFSLKAHDLSIVDMFVLVHEPILHSMGLDNQLNDTRQYAIGGATVGLLGVKT